MRTFAKKSMRKYSTIAIGAAMYCTGLCAQISMPAPSSTQTIRQDFGMGKIEVTYSRPSIKGRQLFKEGSELAPFGKLWRTGANAATRIRFTDKVNIGGTSLDSGTYALYTIPNNNQWEVILNKGFTNSGTDGYKEADDVVRVKVPATKTNGQVETFTMQFQNIKPESCDLQLMWGNTAVNVPITTNVKDRIRAQIETALKGERKPYQQAASFYYEWDKDYPKALENINRAIEASPNAFFLYLTKARIQKDLGDKQGAKTSAAKCIELATTAKNDDYVRQANELMRKI